MRSRSLLKLSIAVIVGCLLCSARVQAQMPDSTVASSMPQSGSAHHYLGVATETVNPADGSLSFRLPISLPSGRGLTMPFGINYAYPYNLYVTNNGPGVNLFWGADLSHLTNAGWSLDEPYLLGMTTAFARAYNQSTNQTSVCLGSGGYAFRGFDQLQRSFALWNQYLDQNSNSNNIPGFCPQTANVSSDTRHGYLATTPTTWQLYLAGPPVTVTDQIGTVYSFPNPPGVTTLQNQNPPIVYWKLRPTSITDRNGNQMVSTSNGWTDTLGRSVVSWSTDQNTITVSGLSGNIVQKWTTISGGTALSLTGTGSSPNGYNGCAGSGGGSMPPGLALTEIDLPNGQKYQLGYDTSDGARVNKITFPTGGYVRYVWGINSGAGYTVQNYWQYTGGGYTQFTCNFTYDKPAITDRYVSYDGSTEVLHQHFVYTTNWNATAGQVWKTTTITTTDNVTGQSTITVYNYGFTFSDTVFMSGGSGGLQNYVPIEQSVIYQDGSGHTLKTVNKTWLNTYAMIGEQTILDNGQATTVLRCYDANEQVADIYEYGFASEGSKPSDPPCSTLPNGTTLSTGLNTSVMGPLRRHTATAYHNFAGGSPSTHIVSEPDSVTVYGGSGSQLKQTSYAYDGSSVVASSVATGHVNPPGLRGNATSITHWLNTGGSSPLTSYTFYDTGQTATATDACGNTTCADMTGTNHTTTYSYSDNYASGTGTPPGQTFAYLTQVTHPPTANANHTQRFTWGYNDGLIRSHTDVENSLTTSVTYNAPPSWCSFSDGLNRLSTVTNPDGGTTSYCYNDTPPAPTVATHKQINASQTLITVSVTDGMGHIRQTQLTSDPQGTVYTDNTFDGLGRVRTVSNPYRQGTDITTTTGITTYGYDPLGRKISETYPDNSVLATAYCGPSTLVTDPTNRWRRSRTDGLGFLVEVDEPNAVGATVNPNGCPGTGEPIWVSSYGRDTLGNLTSVLENGSHSRSFTFDSLSRMLTSNNPEVGTLTYVYDANGNVNTKKDARNITTTYGYDVLNRPLSRSYSNGDPTISVNYDETNCLGLPACQNIGQRTSMTDAAGPEAWAYQVDAGNHRSVHVNQRTTSNITKTSTYYLDLAGNVTQAIYPTGRVVNYTFDAANRPSTATDGSNGVTYATGFKTSPGGTCLVNVTCYTPQGTFYALSIGQSSSFTGLNLTHTYNNRLQPNEFKASSSGGNAIDITYNFVDPVSGKNAGHVYGITNILDTTRSQTFTYDQLNRIASALTTSTHATSPSHCWGENYTLDAWGNLNSIAATTNSNYTGCSQESGFSSTADGNNHLPAWAYDVSGNATSDGFVTNYQWNAESELKSAAGITYLYEGDGRRVSKSNGSVSKLYWYGSGGEILSETDGAGNMTHDYIFFAGKRIAFTDGGSPDLYVEDMLGTSRAMTWSNGSLCYDADFYPYGGERAYTNTCTQEYKFEGKERDPETGNDDFGARYYSNRFGRWLSADWSAVPVPVPYANLTNPQTLNLYSMVADDPESFADLDGHLGCASPSGAASTSATVSNSAGFCPEVDPHSPVEVGALLGTAQMAPLPLENQDQEKKSPQKHTHESDPSVARARKAYKWYQFVQKWFDRYEEVKKLRDEERSDKAIYDMAGKIVFDPVGNYNSPVYPYMANIAELERANLYLDNLRQGLKLSTEVDPAAALMGASYNEMFNNYGNQRDANNKVIDELLGQAAAAQSPH